MTTGFTIWFTGLSGAGKSTISAIVEQALRARGCQVEVLDGDVVRTHLSKGLGFSKEDRDTNIRRIGWVCEVLTRNDVVAIAAAISPYRAIRDEVREKIGRFVEVHVATPLEECRRRDPKGLFARAEIAPAQFITHLLPLDRWEEGFKYMYLGSVELFYLSLSLGFLILVLCAVLVVQQILQILTDVKKITGDVSGMTGDITTVRESLKVGGLKLVQYFLGKVGKGGASK